MNEWDPLTVKRLLFVPFVLQQWIVLVCVVRSRRVRRVLLQPTVTLWRFGVFAVLLGSLFAMLSGYMWLNHSIAGPRPRDDDPILQTVALVQLVTLLLAVFVAAKRLDRDLEALRGNAHPPAPPKPTPRLLLLLLVVWVIVFGSLTAISIGPLAVLPVSRRDGLTMAAATVLGALPLALFLWLSVRQKRKDAGPPPR